MMNEEDNINEQSVREDAFRAEIEAEMKAIDSGKDLQKEIETIGKGVHTEAVDVADKAVNEVKEATEEQTSSKDERVYSELEQEQMALGWDPNHKDGVSAKEFKRVGEIIEAKRNASKKAQEAGKEVIELTKTVKQLVEHNKRVELAAYERAKQELATQKIQKIQEGDVEAVMALEVQQQQLVQPVVEDKPQEPGKKEVSQEAKDFQEKNKSWMHGNTIDDRRMQMFLIEKIKDYEKMQSLDPAFTDKEAITLLEEELHAKFPTKFNNPNKNKPSAVGVSTTSNKTNNSTFSDDEKSTLLTLQRVDPYYKTAEGIKEFTNQVKLVRKS